MLSDFHIATPLLGFELFLVFIDPEASRPD
jgi:hypothetical protein